MNAPLSPQQLQRIDMGVVRAAAGGAITLPSVPRVVRKLIGQLRAADISVSAVVAELEKEPQLAARTLRIANSPYYCGRRSVASVSDAVIAIGTDTLRTLVISCGLQAVFVEVPSVNLRQFWLDASITAKAARSLARLARLGGNAADADAAFLAGLLHAVGHLILCQAFPAEMQQKMAGASTRRGAELAAIEAEACGLTHLQVGAAWLDELGFPHDIAEAIARQLDAHAAPQTLAPLLALAVQVAASVEVGDSAESAIQKLDPALLAAASLTPEALNQTFPPQYRQIVASGGDL